MAQEGIYMDVPAVQSMADGFRGAGEVLNGVSTALEAAIMILKVTAFIGLVGGFAVEHFLSQIQPKVKVLAEKCDELNMDLIGAIVSYRDGDDSGSKRFR